MNKGFRAAVVGLLLFNIQAADATAQGFHLKSDVIERNKNTLIYVGGIAESVASRTKAFHQCKRSQYVSRGEFETRAEFEARKLTAKRDCEGLRKYDAYLETDVNLRYHADEELFTFNIINAPMTEYDLRRDDIAIDPLLYASLRLDKEEDVRVRAFCKIRRKREFLS